MLLFYPYLVILLDKKGLKRVRKKIDCRDSRPCQRGFGGLVRLPHGDVLQRVGGSRRMTGSTRRCCAPRRFARFSLASRHL